MKLTQQEQKAIWSAKRGGSIEIADLHFNLPQIPLSMTAGGPPMVFSDDPEYIRVPQAGAMREAVRPGVFRLYTYHVNGVRGTVSRITNVIENLGNQPMCVRLLRRAFPKPGNEYNQVGCDGLEAFLTSTPEEKGRVVPVGGAIALDPEMENTPIAYDDLAHGFYEIHVNQPAKITALQTSLDKSGIEANKEITQLLPIPKEGNAGRGYYPFSDYYCTTPDYYALDTANGPVQLVVADGITYKWLTGWSSDLEQPTVLAGNYGVMYDITLKLKHSDGRSWALLMWNHRAHDQWCGGLAMVIKVNGELMRIPGDCVKIGAAPHACVIGVFEPSDEPIHLVYSPPGASCLPNAFVFVPIEK